MIKLLAFISLFFATHSEAQQYNTWYFGTRAGISFNEGEVTLPYTLTDGVINNDYGCSASISDSNGDILFYTNARTVYNRTHQVMLNGENLKGNLTQSAAQGVLIVPLPNSDSIYYIFTTDGLTDGFVNGYRYSIVNMKHDSGKGEVVTKNVLLSPSCTERLTAARHANGIDVWIIGNQKNSNVFMSWLLTCTGLQQSPVKSIAGTILNANYDEGSIGIMKVSPDGKQLCQTTYPGYPGKFFQLFDFDNAIGILSNALTIKNTGSYNLSYACEFSPDSKFLYIPHVQSSFIDQFETKLGSLAAITGSRVSIPTADDFSNIQTGPDEKIYLSRKTTKLSVINYPNVKGTGCYFELDKIDLKNRNSESGFPAAINDWPYDPYNNLIFQIIDSCKGSIQFNGQTNITSPLWYWDFGDGSTSTLQNPKHTFAPPYNKLYTVKLRITSITSCGYIEKRKAIVPTGIFTTPDFDFVSRCDSDYVRFVNKSTIFPSDSSVQYTWDFGDGNTSTQKNPVHTYAGAGNYSVQLKTTTANKACLDDSIVKSIDQKQLSIQASPGKTINPGEMVQLFVTGGGNSFQWFPNRWLDNPSIANPVAKPQDNITYEVTVRNEQGCKAVDSVIIKVNQIMGIYIPSAFTPDNDGLNDIFRPVLRGGYTLKNFTIFNRWSQKIFSTTEAEKGWDGKLNGELQNAGTYIWSIKVMDAQSKIIEKKGTVALIR